MKVIRQITIGLTLILSSCVAFSQSIEILPDSLSVDDFAEIQTLKVHDLKSSAPAPVFSNADMELSNVAHGFTITIPATDFFPEILSPVDNAGSPVLGQTRVFNGGEVQGYGNSNYAFSAPLYLPFNNSGKNIKITEIELCGLDRNANLDLFAAVYSTAVGEPGPLVTAKQMEVKSNGAAASNAYNCWSADSKDDDFEVDYEDFSYWLKVIPRNNALNSIEDPCPGECQEEWGTVINGAGVLKLVHVKVTYSFLPSATN